MSGRLWDKGVELDARVLRYTAGEDHLLDDRLVSYDVRASVAHAESLCAAGLLAVGDRDAVVAGLRELAATHEAGAWHVELADEDVHTALERRLTELIGPTGGRLHLGRSRNDQVLATLRLYLRDAVGALAAGAEDVAAALDDLAARTGDVVVPGYTHTRAAMPSTAALWCGGYASELRDDAAGMRAALRRIDRCPLGSAAGYGVPLLELDRADVARRLGFAEVQEPVTAAQISRGKAESQVLFESALLATDLGRLAADLVLLSSDEYGMFELPEAMTTGSSIMPHKRNPDVFELVRGRTATAHAALLEALGVTAKLTGGYHRDLQLLKAPLMRGVDLSLDTTAIVAHALGGVRFTPERMHLGDDLWATEAAYRLVLAEGVPFREAYRRVAAGEGRETRR